MASGHYNYPPPPPPPPSVSSFQQYAYESQAPRGGGRGRSRGGHNHNQASRGDFHASNFYSSHGPAYSAQTSVNSVYGSQSPSQFSSLQSSPAASNYPPAAWGQQAPGDHRQQAVSHMPMHHQPAPPPVPLSAQNYHPNYAPQVYQQSPAQQQPPQYGQQQSFHQSPPSNTYAPHVSNGQSLHTGGPPQHWQGQPQQGPPSFQGANRGRGRGRSSFPTGRGGFDAPLMGPPIRMGFDGDRPGESMSQASNGYPAPFGQNQYHSPPAPAFESPAYQGFPPQDSFSRGGHRGGFESNHFSSRGSHNHRGNRGGMQYRGNKHNGHAAERNRPSNDRYRGTHEPNSRKLDSSHPTKPANADALKSGDMKKKKKKKRKTNTLGLTPATEEYDDSEEEADDVDEEAHLAAGVANLEIPSEPSDLSSWLAERRAKWPTKARREAKEAELARRRAHAAEQSARDKAKSKHAKADKVSTAHEKGVTEKGKSDAELAIEKQKKKAEKLRKALERAEQKVQEAMKAGMKRKREDNDSGDDDGTKQDGDVVDQVIAEATAAADSDSTADATSEYESGTDSDGEPDVTTSRQTAPVHIHQPKKPTLDRQCKYFSTGGTCGKKGKCRFIHDQAVRDAALREKDQNFGRMTLAQRLIQNEKDKDDLVIVKSIKYLYEHGLLDEKATEEEVT